MTLDNLMTCSVQGIRILCENCETSQAAQNAEPCDKPDTVHCLREVHEQSAVIEKDDQAVQRCCCAVLWDDGGDGQSCEDVWVLQEEEASIATNDC